MAESTNQSVEHEVIKTILNGYDVDGRPVQSPSDIVTVTMGLVIRQIIDLVCIT